MNAAGLQADTVSAMFGAESFVITPRKGEEFILDKGSAGPPTRVVFPVPSRTSKGVLVIPTVEGTVMIGPTAEEGEDKQDTATTPENLERVFHLASAMVPRISKKDIITSFAGLRPTLPGDDFYIDLSKEAACFVQVAGIQSPGLTASPAIAERVKDLLKAGGLSLREKSDWHPGIPRMERTRDHAAWEIDRLVARDPAYAHMVCRCEKVSEAEVVEAIRKGHTTLDGIKYYTRCGMGRCQGGFCTYRIMQIVARETGLPLERITKHGPGQRGGAGQDRRAFRGCAARGARHRVIQRSVDAVVVGGGSAGLAAALRLREAGASVAIVEREPFLGGILLQCIHSGFGLHEFRRGSHGPRVRRAFRAAGARLRHRGVPGRHGDGDR